MSAPSPKFAAVKSNLLHLRIVLKNLIAVQCDLNRAEEILEAITEKLLRRRAI